MVRPIARPEDRAAAPATVRGRGLAKALLGATALSSVALAADADCDDTCEARFKAASESLGQLFARDVLGSRHEIDPPSFTAGIEAAMRDPSAPIEHDYAEIAEIFEQREIELRMPDVERLRSAFLEHALEGEGGARHPTSLERPGEGGEGLIMVIEDEAYLHEARNGIYEAMDDPYRETLFSPHRLRAGASSSAERTDATSAGPSPDEPAGEGAASVLPEASEVTVSYRRLTPSVKGGDVILRAGEWQTRRFPFEGVIEGWQLAIARMQEQDLARVLIPPELAYGYRGAGDDIASGETLLYEILLQETHGD